MAKKQSAKDRRHERVGEEKALKRKRRYHSPSDDLEGPLNYDRRKEARDYKMLSEDYHECANLPQDVKYHEWPEARNYAASDLDDTISGINKQISEDGAQMARHRSRSKY